jgi:hypothetical protein
MNDDLLTLDQLRERAPSAFATHPVDEVSEKYVFVPTTDVLDALAEEGWYPSGAREMPVHGAERKGFQPHELTFHHEKLDYSQFKTGDVRIQLRMLNSHDRTKAWRMYGGLYRLICSNGMVVSVGTFEGARIKHIHTQVPEIIAASRVVAAKTGIIRDQVHLMQKKSLTADERTDFAGRVLSMRYGEDVIPPIKADQLLEARREDDEGITLWKVMNRVQENIIRGGVRGETVIPLNDGQEITRHTVTQPIRNFNRDVSLNQAMWEIAEQFINN